MTTQRPQEIAKQYAQTIIEDARRQAALRRHYPDAACHWQRIESTGSELIAVVFCREADRPRTEVWPLSRLDALAADVTQEEVHTELSREPVLDMDQEHFEQV